MLYLAVRAEKGRRGTRKKDLLSSSVCVNVVDATAQCPSESLDVGGETQSVPTVSILQQFIDESQLEKVQIFQFIYSNQKRTIASWCWNPSVL